MANTITKTILNDSGEEIDIQVPYEWEICSTCDGHGKHSAHLGAFTAEDIANDWDPESWENYLSGGYDRTCEDCGGSGKVKAEDWEKLPAEDRKMLEDWAESERELRQEEESERRFGC